MSDLEESAGRELVVELLHRLASQRGIPINSVRWDVNDHDDEYTLIFVAAGVTSRAIVPFEVLADAQATPAVLDGVSDQLRGLLDRSASTHPRNR